jgi:hypothetical protein
MRLARAAGAGRAALAATLLLTACGRGGEAPAPADGQPADSAAPPPASGIAVSLVDSLPWANMLEAGVRHRVVVTAAGRTDTIPGVAATSEPVVAEGRVHGFTMEGDGSIPAGFVYDAASRDLERVPLPDDFTGFTAFALSPDAAYLAYAGRAEDGSGLAGVIRRWPGGELLYRSDGIAGYPSDAANSEVEWHGPSAVEIRIRTDDVETEGGTWLRLRGVPGSEMLADTVRGIGD